MAVDHTKNIIEVKNVSFSYFPGTPAVHDVNLNIHEGDYLGIIGPNGGGKSTLLKLIVGILKPDIGNITIFGSPLEQFKDWPLVGYVSQKAADTTDPLFPATVKDIVSMGRYSKRGLFHGLTSEDKRKIDQAIEHVGMTEFKNRLIGNLSGGQEQKVFIARALAQEPKVIFLDEPTSGVDEASQEQFYQLLRKLNRELGITLVLISHDIDVVTKEVTEVAAINQKIVYYGSAKDFIKEEHHDALYHKGLKFIHHEGHD